MAIASRHQNADSYLGKTQSPSYCTHTSPLLGPFQMTQFPSSSSCRLAVIIADWLLVSDVLCKPSADKKKKSHIFLSEQRGQSSVEIDAAENRCAQLEDIITRSRHYSQGKEGTHFLHSQTNKLLKNARRRGGKERKS